MRKLPEGCPTKAIYSPSWGGLFGGDGKFHEGVEVEIHPLGSRALMAELVGMVEDVAAAECNLRTKYECGKCRPCHAAALLAKARETTPHTGG